MSRIGKKPVQIPAGVEVAVNDQNVAVKGPKGQLDFTFAECISVNVEGNEAISRVHARILYAGDQFVVEDMGSSNKTYINGDVLAPHDPVALRDGDTLRLANEEFTVWIA